jgi:chemotaxis protein MotB
VLRALDDDLAIEGHTNQAPGAPKYFASDWDLSAARAVTVLRQLNEERGVPAERLSAVGFGKIRPLVDPDEPGSQQLNKRVDIVVLSGLTEENRELLDRVVYDRNRPVSQDIPAPQTDQTQTDQTQANQTQFAPTGKETS